LKQKARETRHFERQKRKYEIWMSQLNIHISKFLSLMDCSFYSYPSFGWRGYRYVAWLIDKAVDNKIFLRVLLLSDGTLVTFGKDPSIQPLEINLASYGEARSWENSMNHRHIRRCAFAVRRLCARTRRRSSRLAGIRVKK